MPTFSSRPRILTVFPNLARGGGQLAQLGLLCATADRYEHLVVSLDGGPLAADLQAAGVALVQLPSGALAHGARLPRLTWLMRSFHPHLVVGLMYRGALAATVARFGAARMPLLWSLHGGLARTGARRVRAAVSMLRPLAGSPSVIVYVGHRVAAAHATSGFRAARSVVIHNGCDTVRFEFDPASRARSRAEWGFAESDVVVGHVARANPLKDHPTMLAALARAFARDDRLRAVLCGAGTASLAVPDALRPRLRLLGPRVDVPAVMAGCDIGALSSVSEAFPRVLLEFMACRRPCVATDVGDSAEIVGRFGAVVPPRTPDALTEAMLELARLDPSLRCALGDEARASIAARFEIGAVTAAHVALWEELISASGAG